MEYVIYCDESRFDDVGDYHPFFSIGGLWVPRTEKERLTKEFQQLRKQHGLRGEVKWSKVSARTLPGYIALAEFFFKNNLKYRAIVVEQKSLTHDDKELGFYKFYYLMIQRWLLKHNSYLILLDFKKNKSSDRYIELRRVLRLRARRIPATILDLTVINSSQSPLAQLADLLTGAVAASWCGISADTAKRKLARHIARCAGAPSLRVHFTSPQFSKFNIFKLTLEKR